MEVSSDLLLHGNGTAPNVRGKLEVSRARYARDISLRDFVLVSEPPPVSESLAESLPWLSEVSLDLEVTNGLPVEVAINADFLRFAAELGVDVAVSGVASHPVPKGRVSIMTGDLIFGRTKLNVTDGHVDFSPRGTETEVLLDVFAADWVEANDTRYWVTVGLEGSTNAIELALNSDPPLDRLGVLSLLLTGNPGVESLASRSNSSSETTAALSLAASQLSGPVNDFVEGKVEQLLNVEIDLETQVNDEGIRVEVQKDLTRRLELKGGYSYSYSGTGSASTASARLLLSDRLYLQGGADLMLGRTDTADDQDFLQGRLELRLRLFER